MNRRVFSDHRPILAILGAFIALALAYSVSTPLFEAPDEQWHYAFVQYVAQGHGLPVQTRNPDQLARQEASQPPLYYLLAAAATFWIDTSAFPAIIWENPHYGYDVPGVVNDNKNLFIHTAAESFPYRGAVLATHLARIVSVFVGAVAVLCSYLLALEIARERKWLAAGAAGFVAFVPQFIFVSGAVSNDSTIVAMSALSLWLMLRLFFIQPRLRDTIALGVAAGLAALAKVSGLGIAVLAVFAIAWVHRKNTRTLVTHCSLFIVYFLLVAGWWYARNWVLYGELTGTEMMLRVFGERGALLTIQQLATQLSEVWETFWIGFGWGNIRAQSIVYALFGLLVVSSALGWVVALARGKTRPIENKVAFSILAFWIFLTFTLLLRWMEVTQAPHGRLFFPVLPALAPLMIFGLVQLVPPRAYSIGAYVPPMAMFAISLYAFVFILRPAYAFPPSLNAADVEKIANRVDIVYDGKMKLLGYDISPKHALPDGSVTLALYWQSLAQMDEDYSIGISVLDSENDVLSKRNSYPGHGALPTRLLRPGQMIRDIYWVPVPASAPAPNIAQIQVSLFRREDKHDLTAVDPNGNAVTPIIGQFKITSPQPIEAHPRIRTDYVFGNQIMLVGYDLDSSGLTLYWKRISPIDADYTVFIHILDSNDTILAQKDSQPNQPTLFWDYDEAVIDHHSFSPPRGATHVRVGLYRAENGQRLAIKDSRGMIVGDSVTFGVSP